jgi:hypothetical protein
VNDAGKAVEVVAASDAYVIPASLTLVGGSFPEDEDDDADDEGAGVESLSAFARSIAELPEQPPSAIATKHEATKHEATSAVDRMRAHDAREVPRR